MGMDVYGRNPKQNKNIDDFPTMKKYDAMDFSDRWKEFDKDESLQNKYWKEKNKWEKSNPGIYFRNNCWSWRPLWDYCRYIADDLISQELWENGHNNDGAGLNDKDAKLLGNRLMDTIADGTCIQYQADYMQRCQENADAGDKFAKSYHFDVDNVEKFALFCIESGGFEIC